MNYMADVQPLRGIRYANETIGDLAQVVTPPYDVITSEAQATYYARNPYNFIRLELGQESAKDTTLNNRYTRAATTFAEWRKNGLLRQDITDRKSTRLNSSHSQISYAVFCLKKKLS